MNGEDVLLEREENVERGEILRLCKDCVVIRGLLEVIREGGEAGDRGGYGAGGSFNGGAPRGLRIDI